MGSFWRVAQSRGAWTQRLDGGLGVSLLPPDMISVANGLSASRTIGWWPVTPRSCVTVAEIHRAFSITALSRLAYSLVSDTPPSPKLAPLLRNVTLTALASNAVYRP